MAKKSSTGALTKEQHETQDARYAKNHDYDYVFIDEAQDLTPVQLRLCSKLVKNGNIFLTADSNQSIYGRSFSYSKPGGQIY